VEQVKAIVDKELGFADASTTSEEDRDRTAYLYIGNKRVVGMVSAERIDKAYLLLRNRSDDQSSSNLDSFERSKEPAKAMLGIHQLWVHRNRRKQGVASKLVSASRERMIFGLTVPIDQLAFSSPTEAGIQFARHYVAPDHRVLVYDCAA
jgi:N-acetyltransferase